MQGSSLTVYVIELDLLLVFLLFLSGFSPDTVYSGFPLWNLQYTKRKVG